MGNFGLVSRSLHSDLVFQRFFCWEWGKYDFDALFVAGATDLGITRNHECSREFTILAFSHSVAFTWKYRS